MIVPLSLRSFINRKRLFGIDPNVEMKGRGRYLQKSLPKVPKGLSAVKGLSAPPFGADTHSFIYFFFNKL